MNRTNCFFLKLGLSRYKELTFFLYLCSNDGSEFGGSIYQKVSDNLETAVNLAWTAGSNSTRFGIAAKYKLDSTASISVSMSLTKRVILNSSFSVPEHMCIISTKDNWSKSLVRATVTIQMVVIKQYLNHVTLHIATSLSESQMLPCSAGLHMYI